MIYRTLMGIISVLGIITSLVWIKSDFRITRAAMVGNLKETRELWESNNLEARYFFAINITRHAEMNSKITTRDRYKLLKEANRIFDNIKTSAPKYWEIEKYSSAVKEDLRVVYGDTL